MHDGMDKMKKKIQFLIPERYLTIQLTVFYFIFRAKEADLWLDKFFVLDHSNKEHCRFVDPKK
jgi:hypothetical protein